jgi:hypothetical protein
MASEIKSRMGPTSSQKDAPGKVVISGNVKPAKAEGGGCC